VLDTDRTDASSVETNRLKPSTVWAVRGEGAFAEIRATGRSRRDGRLVVVRSDGQGGGPAELGLIVGKTVGNAVVRNRVRRQIRAIVRESAPSHRGARYVVRALPGAGDQPYGALRASFNKCLEGFSS
jgi:ribonuclease P protein component